MDLSLSLFGRLVRQAGGGGTAVEVDGWNLYASLVSPAFLHFI